MIDDVMGRLALAAFDLACMAVAGRAGRFRRAEPAHLFYPPC